MKYGYNLLGVFLLSSFLLAGCNEENDSLLGKDSVSETVQSGYFDATFFANQPVDVMSNTRTAINGQTDRVQSLMYILYKKDENNTYQYVKQSTLFRPDNYSIIEQHQWPYGEVKETLPDGDYKVVFLGNLDSNLFPGQGTTSILSDYKSDYNDARINMPASGPTAFTNTNMFYMATADFNQNNPNVNILLQRIVTQHEYQRDFVDTNHALEQLTDSIVASINNTQLTTNIVSGLLHSALLEPIQKIPGIDAATALIGGVTKVVDTLVGGLTGPLITALDKVLVKQISSRLESTLVTQGGKADLLGLSNVLNPWAIYPSADISGKFVSSVNFDLQQQSANTNPVTWENIPMLKVPGEEETKTRYLSMTLLNGDNDVTEIDIKKEGLTGPLLDGLDDDVLYGRLINIKNELSYTASPNVKYHTNYDLLNLKLNDYTTSDNSETVNVSVKLSDIVSLKDLLKSLLGGLGGLVGGLLDNLLDGVFEAIEKITISLDIKLPDLGIGDISLDGGWLQTTNSLSNNP